MVLSSHQSVVRVYWVYLMDVVIVQRLKLKRAERPKGRTTDKANDLAGP